jgi:hypothetical protein
MRKFRRIALSFVLAVALVAVFVAPVAAANPTVTISMKAKVISITNTQSSWNITAITGGAVITSDTIYFSVNGEQDDDYSQIENTGNVAVDIEIRGTDMEGGDYDLTLASDGNPGSEIYGVKAWGGADYTIVVKSSAYNDITTNLAADGTYDWSAVLYTPTAFNANDDGNEKTATVTLVASEHT